MSLEYLILGFLLLNLISPKLKIRKLSDEEYDMPELNDGEEKKVCDLRKDEEYDNSYEFLGKIKSGSEIHLEVKISKEDYNKDIGLSYCAMEDLSEDSAFHCMFGGRTHPIYDKKEEENYKIFSASFGLKKDYDYIIFFIEVPSNVDLNCITIKFYSEGDEGTIIIIVVVILVIVVILGIAFLYFRHKKKKENAMKNELENIQKKRVEAIMLDERKKENNQNTINKKPIKDKD